MISEQREELQSWAQSRSLPAGYVFRARLILAIGEVKTYREIEDSLGANAPTVSKWKGQFEQLGMEGLQGRHKGSTQRDAGGAGARDPARPTEAARWLDALVGVQAGRGHGRE